MNEFDPGALARIPKFPRGVRLKHDETRQEWVLLAPERLIKCDPIAAAVLQLCDGKRAVSDVVDILAGQYNADPTLIARDVLALLDGLRDKKMVQV